MASCLGGDGATLQGLEFRVVKRSTSEGRNAKRTKTPVKFSIGQAHNG
jgi:hypothetical protein